MNEIIDITPSSENALLSGWHVAGGGQPEISEAELCSRLQENASTAGSVFSILVNRFEDLK